MEHNLLEGNFEIVVRTKQRRICGAYGESDAKNKELMGEVRDTESMWTIQRFGGTIWKFSTQSLWTAWIKGIWMLSRFPKIKPFLNFKWLISHMLMENIVPSVLTPASVYIWCRWDISGWRDRAGPKAPFCCPWFPQRLGPSGPRQKLNSCCNLCEFTSHWAPGAWEWSRNAALFKKYL